jgi:glycosyltransferase 2 family protein
MKALTPLFAIGGLIFGTALVGYFGFSEVAHALFAVRWTGFLTIIAYHLAVTALLGVCWYLLTPPPAPLIAFVFGRLIRDSGSEILPLSQVGGFVMGARAAALLGLPSAVAIASTIVDVTLEMLAQLGYTALGLSILSAQKPDNPLIAWTAFGIVLALLAAIAFILVQRHGFTLVESMVRRVPYRWAKGVATRLAPIHRAIHQIYRRPSALWSAGFLHVAMWVATSVEAWIALRLMGASLSIASVIAIESLLYAIRSIAFVVPSAFGVQEGAYVLLGILFGFGPEVALALSLLKRARDLVIGVPALLTWQIIESRRLLGGLTPVRVNVTRTDHLR